MNFGGKYSTKKYNYIEQHELFEDQKMYKVLLHQFTQND